MYKAFYGFRQKPFSLLPDPEFLFPSQRHRMAMALLEYSLLTQTSFTVVTGGIGTGKTTLIRYLLGKMERDVTVGLITNTHQSFGELLQWVLLAYGLEHRDKGKVEMFQTLLDFLIEEYAQGRRTVLIVDEAQNMSPDALEELRMLSNINTDKDHLLQMVLVGQAGLRRLLKRPDLEQFAQRIAVDYHLEPLSAEDTGAYIKHRQRIAGRADDGVFDAGACDEVFRCSGGVPRLINLLCDTALVYGYAEQRGVIDRDLVSDVARDKREGGIFPLAPENEPDDFVSSPEFSPVLSDDVVSAVGGFRDKHHQPQSRRAAYFVPGGEKKSTVAVSEPDITTLRVVTERRIPIIDFERACADLGQEPETGNGRRRPTLNALGTCAAEIDGMLRHEPYIAPTDSGKQSSELAPIPPRIAHTL